MTEPASTDSSSSGATSAAGGGHSSAATGHSSDSGGGKRTAGLFDIRVIIGTLLGVFGLILLLMGLFSDAQARDARANDVNLNLWTGLALLATSAGFTLWARVRPIIVEESPAEQRSVAEVNEAPPPA